MNYRRTPPLTMRIKMTFEKVSKDDLLNAEASRHLEPPVAQCRQTHCVGTCSMIGISARLTKNNIHIIMQHNHFDCRPLTLPFTHFWISYHALTETTDTTSPSVQRSQNKKKLNCYNRGCHLTLQGGKWWRRGCEVERNNNKTTKYKDPTNLNEMMSNLRVCIRAMSIARSFASEPLFTKYTTCKWQWLRVTCFIY